MQERETRLRSQAFEAIRIAQRREVPPGFEEPLLDRVSRELVVPEDQSGRRVQPRDEHAGKHGKGVAIASLCSLDELSLVHVDPFGDGATPCRAREVCRVRRRKGSSRVPGGHGRRRESAPGGARRLQPIEDQPRDALDRDPLLGHRVAVAHGHRAVLERVDVDGDAPRRPDLVLAPVELADRRRVVVDGHRVALEVVLDPVAQLDDLGPLLEQRQDRDLVRREVRMERQRDTRLAADLLLAIGVDEEREGGPVGAGGGLDDPRDDVLVGRLVEVLELLARCLGVARQVEVAPVVDALELLPAEREAVFDVDRLLGVVGQLVGRVLAQAQPRRA